MIKKSRGISLGSPEKQKQYAVYIKREIYFKKLAYVIV